MPLIAASSTTLVPSTAASSYEGWFLSDLHTIGNDPNNVTALVVLRKAHQDDNGVVSFSPQGERIEVTFSNLLANPDPNVQAAVKAVLVAVVSQASTQGIQL